STARWPRPGRTWRPRASSASSPPISLPERPVPMTPSLRVSRRRALAAGGASLAFGPALVRRAAAANGVSDDTIRLGQSAVFSGPAQDFGIDYRAGLQLSFDRIN